MPSLIDEWRGKADAELSEVHRHFRSIRNSLARLNQAAEIAKHEWFQRNAQATVAGGATDVQIPIDRVPGGTYWLIKNLTTTGGANGPCAVYLDAVAPTQLAYFVPNAQIFSPEGGMELFVRGNQQLIFHFYAQVAGQICTVWLQGKQYAEPALYDAPDGQFEDSANEPPVQQLEPLRTM